MRQLLLAALLATGATVAMPAQAAPADDLKAVLDDHWRWYLRNAPVYASALGVHDYDEELGDYSLEGQDRQAAEARSFIARLDAIPDAGLAPAGRTDKAILRRLLAEQIEANSFGARMMLFTTYASWFQSIAGIAEGLSFRAKADYASYLTRLGKFPQGNAVALDITRRAVKAGYVQPCAVLDANFETSISGVITATPEESRFYAPFRQAKPADATDAEWAALKARARTLISDVLNPEYRKIADFMRKDYIPHCRKTLAATALPQGKAYYAFQVRQQTTTDLSPEAIHQIGLDEIRRIGTEMDAVARKAGFAGRQAFIATLRSDPKYYARSADELMAAAALQAKIIDGKMPGYFGKLPRLPYGVRAIPAETAEGTTTAYYMPGSPPAGLSGTYYVNTSKLDQRPLYELPALTAHEAVPGHHNQIALQQEMDLPAFRKYAAFFNAFVEGWALYCEHLGIEMGLYDTPEKEMGRLSYEAWRASRLAVDTGIHAKGWSKEQAVAFMKDNTALSEANINAEVNRYISWPAQALGYKLGELKIRALRKKAEEALGTTFDLRAFHDAVLGQGSVPLDVLEAQITIWIAAQKAGS